MKFCNGKYHFLECDAMLSGKTLPMFRENGLLPSSQCRRTKETFQVGNLFTRYSKQEGQCCVQNRKERIYNMRVLKLAYIFQS
jgi:hypothetical protein